MPKVTDADYDNAPDKLVSVIIPMRDEEGNAAKCLEGILDQDYENYEVIVVDDGSSDGTSEILTKFAEEDDRLKVLRVEDKPEGWIGKNYALHRGVELASGELFLFLDADTITLPTLMSQAVSYLEAEKLDMLSLYPFQHLKTFWERVIEPFVFLIILHVNTPANINDPNREDAAACGQFILIKREVYKASGGHEILKEKIVEDMEMARLLKSEGYRIGVASGAGLISTRMYTSLGEIWEGWTKNMYPAIQGRLLLLLRGITMVSLWGLLPPILLLLTSLWFSQSSSPMTLILLIEALWIYGLNIYVTYQNNRAYSIPTWYALSTPLSALAFLSLLFGSMYKVFTKKGLKWKGRVYSKG